MASELSSIEAFPRIWAIEALARSKQLNAELLDLVRKTPELSDDIGKNARELVSFRILESLFSHRSQNDIAGASVPSQRIYFDPSNSCEDVLHHVLQKIPASNLNCGSSEMLKWDVQSFIAHKRDRLPVSSLQKLKDAVLDGSHSVFASFKERSGLTVRTQCDDNITGDGDNSNGSAWRLEERSKDIQVLPDLCSCPNTTEKGVDELQEGLPDRDSLPSKRNRTDTSGEKLERGTHKDQVMHGDCYDQYAESAKKFKQDVHITELVAVERSIIPSKDGQVENSYERIVEHIDKEVCNMENEAEVEGMEMEYSGTHDAGNKHIDKKFKQDISITKHDAMVKSTTSTGDGLLANSSEKPVERIDREGCDLEKEDEIGVTDKHTDFADDGEDQFTALKMLAGNSDFVGAGDRNCQVQTPAHHNIDVSVPGDARGRSNSVGEANGCMKRFDEKASNGTALDINEERNKVNEGVNSLRHNSLESTLANEVEHNQVFETASDSDEYRDERNDIASKKNAFLSSQCTYSEESLETQQNLCMKCNSSGRLLICSSNTCPLMVHESCLGSAAKFDGDGKFYCPFCAYSRALSEYLGVKRKASLARKDLATFIGLKVGNQAKLSTRSRRSEKNQATGSEKLDENNEANVDGDPLNEVDHTLRRPNEEDRLQVASTSSAGNSLPCSKKLTDLSLRELKALVKENLQGEGKEQERLSPIQPDEQQIDVHRLRAESSTSSAVNTLSCAEKAAVCHGLEKENLEAERKEKERQSPIQPEEQQIDMQALHESNGDISAEKQMVVVNGNERQTVVREQKKITHTPESSLHSELPNQKGRESSVDNDEKTSGSKYPRRSGRQDKQYTSPPIPQLRRRRHPWTQLEVEKLEEGVKKFSSDQELSIPWKQILEFGAGVFEKGRTQVDLKDKWRNICRAGQKSK